MISRSYLIEVQIEQYIESVFPTQDHRLMPGAGASQPKALTLDEAEQKKLEAEAKQDTSKSLKTPKPLQLY